MKVQRRGVRVVEGARLESVYTRKGIAGSNPALSASAFINYRRKLAELTQPDETI